MSATKSLLRSYFGRFLGLPCWGVSSEFGSWLSLNFGNPHLETREGDPHSKLEVMRQRSIDVIGDHRLWIEMGAWSIFNNRKMLFHSDQSREQLRRAAARLDSQLFLGIEIQIHPLQSSFFFENDDCLNVSLPQDANLSDGLWHVYRRQSCLTLLATGQLEFGRAWHKKKRIAAGSSILAA